MCDLDCVSIDYQGFMIGALAATMTAFTTSMDLSSDQKTLKLRSVKAWMKQQSLPKTVQALIINYFQSQFQDCAVFEGKMIMDELPPALAGQVSAKLYYRLLPVFPFDIMIAKEEPCFF